MEFRKNICRHTLFIVKKEDFFVKKTLANVNYSSKIKYARPKMKDLSFFLLSGFIIISLLIFPAAAAIEWKISPSDPTLGNTLKIKGTASPGESIKADVSFEKRIPVSGGRYQLLLENIKVPDGIDNRFTVRTEDVKNLHLGVKKLIWFNLNSDASKGVATISQAHVPPWSYDILIDGNALRGEHSVDLRITASQTLKANSKGKFEYSYDTSSMPPGEFRIKIGNLEKTIELKYRQQKPVADFSAAPTSGYVPLKVTFTDKSTGSPRAWKWNFGDGKTSNEQNPVHTYNKAGKYTVSLKIWNAAGTSTIKKSYYIYVKSSLKAPIADFSAAPAVGKVPLKVIFTDKTKGMPASWK